MPTGAGVFRRKAATTMAVTAEPMLYLRQEQRGSPRRSSGCGVAEPHNAAISAHRLPPASMIGVVGCGAASAPRTATLIAGYPVTGECAITRGLASFLRSSAGRCSNPSSSPELGLHSSAAGRTLESGSRRS